MSGLAVASQMTLLEEGAYWNPGPLDVTHGYPEHLSPRWIARYQHDPATGFLETPAAEYAEVIRGHFRTLFGWPRVELAPTCSMGFAVAAQALTQSPGDEFVLCDLTYDSYSNLLRSCGARPVYARRGPGGLPDPEAIAAACTPRTRAVVVASPDNPLGVVTPAEVMRQLIAVCETAGVALVADHCLCQVNPFGREIPLLPRIAAGSSASWVALGDTGKILGLQGSKFGALACSGDLSGRVKAAASPWYFQLHQYDLWLLATILSDDRFPSYLRQHDWQVRENYAHLRDMLQPPLRVLPMEAGCFALVDAAGLGMHGEAYATLLRNVFQLLVVPVSWFPAGDAPREDTRIRLSLNRSDFTIWRAAALLNFSVKHARQAA